MMNCIADWERGDNYIIKCQSRERHHMSHNMGMFEKCITSVLFPELWTALLCQRTAFENSWFFEWVCPQIGICRTIREIKVSPDRSHRLGWVGWISPLCREPSSAPGRSCWTEAVEIQLDTLRSKTHVQATDGWWKTAQLVNKSQL